jgi:hypothetical protein
MASKRNLNQFHGVNLIKGSSCSQLRMTSLEDTISRDNPVRFIEAFGVLIDIRKITYTLPNRLIKR